MEPPNIEPKLPDMVMCGDHPSFGKLELNVADTKIEEKDKSSNNFKVTPKSSHTGDEVVRSSASEAAMRMLEARRRARSLDLVSRPDMDITTQENKALVQEVGPHCEVLVQAAMQSLELRGRGHVSRTTMDVVVPKNRTLMQAALGSFRWPPYLLCVWVAVLVLTHILHCLVTVLERALPNLRKFCQYFKQWTEDAWKTDNEQNRALPMSLAFVTVLLYSTYFGLYALYTVAYWSIEPLCSDVEVSKSCVDMAEAKGTICDVPKTSCYKRPV